MVTAPLLLDRAMETFAPNPLPPLVGSCLSYPASGRSSTDCLLLNRRHYSLLSLPILIPLKGTPTAMVHSISSVAFGARFRSLLGESSIDFHI